jgi:hypothetical protein
MNRPRVIVLSLLVSAGVAAARCAELDADEARILKNHAKDEKARQAIAAARKLYL